ncbi:MAG: M28 family peptidase [Bacteroidota bacterium]
MRSRFLLVLVLASGLLAAFQCERSSLPRHESITAEEFFHHVKILASDEFEGRRAGTRGARIAAEYVADEFKRYGLKRVGDSRSYFQQFEFIADLQLGSENFLSLVIKNDSSRFLPQYDFMPLSFSDNGNLTAEAAFVGYGISAPDLNYDDYEGIDVKGKVVLALRFTPEGDKPHIEFSRFAALRRKAVTARERGARAIIFVNGPLDVEAGEEDIPSRLRLDYAGGRGGIIAVSAKTKVAEDLLMPMGITLREIQTFLNTEKKPKSFVIPDSKATVSVELIERKATTANVVGLVEGNDPNLKDEVVIVGAHYDHLGFGGQGSMVPDTVAIHNGADDNASGTAGLLELAQLFAARRSDLKRSLLFIAFGGEEEGLLGSAHYVENPIVPLENTVAMVNMDMIGRLKDSSLIVYGAGTSPLWNELIQKTGGAVNFHLKLNEEGFGPSDHASFYGKDMPVLFFFTGLHEDYHRPTDDWQKIQSEDAQRIVQYVHDLVFAIANRTERLLFTKVEISPRPATDDTRTLRAYVGTIPDFSESGRGYKIGGVAAGSPADMAGIKAGDLMVNFGGKEILNIYDYTYALQEFKPGDKVEVVVIRDGEELNMRVTLERRSR